MKRKWTEVHHHHFFTIIMITLIHQHNFPSGTTATHLSEKKLRFIATSPSSAQTNKSQGIEEKSCYCRDHFSHLCIYIYLFVYKGLTMHSEVLNMQRASAPGHTDVNCVFYH